MIKRILIVICGLMLCGTSSYAAGGVLELGVSDVTAHGSWDQTISEDDNGMSVFRIRGLHNSREDTTLASVDLDVFGNFSAVPGLKVGAGVRGYWVDTDHDDITAGGFGLLGELFPPALQGLGFTANMFYCPRIFTGLDADRLFETQLQIVYKIIPRASIFVGYSNIRADMEDTGKRTLDDGFRGGLKLIF